MTTISARDGSAFERFVRRYCIVAFAFTPVLRILLVHDLNGNYSPVAILERSLWISTWLVEAVVIVARPGGFRVLVDLAKGLPAIAKALLALWLFVLAASAATANTVPVLALMGSAEWLFHLVFIASLWTIFVEDGPREPFDRFVAIYPTVTALIGFGLMLVIGVAETQGDYSWIEFMPGFANIRHTGYLFCPAIAIGVARLAEDKALDRRVMAELIANVALCLWFGSRGPISAIFAAFAVGFVLFPQFRKTIFLVRAAIGLILGAAISIVIPSPDVRIFNALLRFFLGVKEQGDLSTGRLELWQQTLAHFPERPIIGHGVRQFQFIVERSRGVLKHPHDAVLQFLFDWGALGGLSAVGLVGILVWTALRGPRPDVMQFRVAAMGLLSMVSFALVDGIMFYSQTIAITAIFALVAIAIRRPLANEE